MPEEVKLDLEPARLNDRDELWDFIRDSYGPSADWRIPERWNWQYLDNPFIDSELEELPVLVARRDGRIVAQMCAIPVKLKLGSKERRAAWAVDLIVDPNQRNLGIGSKLNRLQAEHYRMTMKLTMAHSTRRMDERDGAVNLGEVPLYVWLNPLKAESVRRYLLNRTRYRERLHDAAIRLTRWGKVHRLLPPLVNPALAMVRRRSKKKGQAVEMREVEEFGPEIDRLWEEISPEFEVAVLRTSEFLNWRFSEKSRFRYRKFEAVRDGRVRGYFVMRRAEDVELNLGSIVDFLCGREDRETLEAMLRKATELYGREVDGVECATSIPEFQETLSGMGFIKARAMRPTCLCMDAELKTDVERLREGWLLTKADHDWDRLAPAIE